MQILRTRSTAVVKLPATIVCAYVQFPAMVRSAKRHPTRLDERVAIGLSSSSRAAAISSAGNASVAPGQLTAESKHIHMPGSTSPARSLVARCMAPVSCDAFSARLSYRAKRDQFTLQ